MRRRARFLAFSCTHCPHQDNEAVAWLLEKIQQHKPNLIVHLGDGHEADAASKFPSEQVHDLREEFDSHNALLRAIRKAAPHGARRVWLPGNHDANILAAGRVNPKLRSLCNFYRIESEFVDGHWQVGCRYEYHRKRGVYRVGPVAFCHGYEHGTNADEFHALLLAQPWGLYVGGHTHRPTPGILRARRTQAVPLPYWFANPGTMRDLSPDYMLRKRKHLWGQAIVVGECGTSQVHRESRTWDAHIELFRMADEI